MIATAEYIDWVNYRRLRCEIGMIEPAELEDHYYRHNTAPATVEASLASFHRTLAQQSVGGIHPRDPRVADLTIGT